MSNRLRRTLQCFCLLMLPAAAIAQRAEPLPMPVSDTLKIQIRLADPAIGAFAVAPMPEIPRDLASNAVNQHGVSGAIGAGIGYALVDLINGSAAEKQTTQMQKLLGDFDEHAAFERHLRAVFASSDFARVPEVEFIRAGSERDAAAAQTPGPVLIVNFQLISPGGFGVVRALLSVGKVERRIDAKGRLDSDLQWARSYDYWLRVDPKERANYEAFWQRLPRASLRAMLKRAMYETTQMLAYDFSVAGRAESAEKLSGTAKFLDGLVWAGRLVKSDDRQAWVRGSRPAGSTLTGIYKLNDMTVPDIANWDWPQPASPASNVTTEDSSSR